MTREEWLRAAVDDLRPDFERVGRTVPEDLYISVGFPSKSALAKKNQRIGECWRGTCSADGKPHVFITPLLGDPVRVLDVLVHEMLHATGIMGHGADFRRPALALGLTGKMTATTAGPDLEKRLHALANRLGVFQHRALVVNPADEKKQSTRMLKATCEECEYVIRLTRKWADVGLPTCCCGGEFHMEEKEDKE
jgi:hypothetical protein